MRTRVSPLSEGSPVAVSSRPLLTIEDVAARLAVSVGCVRAWRIKGEGPPAIRVGNSLRWAEKDLEAWLDSRRESRLESA
jgi:excisionase family DNA binding protein